LLRETLTAVAVALAVLLTGWLPTAAVPSAAAATTSSAKVVLIVGATHGTTETYRQRMDVAYAEAIKHSSNVVKVYSPTATWANVKAALQGASVVVYMGHGNGFPSPYRSTPWAYSQNGFGLNGVANQGDHNTTYFGEHYIASEVKLAPNAVVLLHHLCYASGNSEPGHAEPTVTVAKQRTDNYAAGFIAAGARAVIADGHMGPSYYLRSLFTTNQTIDELWRAAPNFHANAFSFASVRRAGYTVQMDPVTPTTGFLRAVTGTFSLRASQVTGVTPPPAGIETFTIPGNAAVAVDSAGVYADAALTPDPATGLAPATLTRDARVRVLARPDTAAENPVLQVEAFDGSAAGFMRAADLAPGDSQAPTTGTVSTGTGSFSPNGDGRQDTLTVSARLSETAWWRVRFWRGTVAVWSGSGTGGTVSATWSGRSGGTVVPDGAYKWTLQTRDDWGNVGATKSGTVTVDTVAPSLSSLSIPATTQFFTPNSDGRADSISASAGLSEAGTITVSVRNQASTTVRSISAASSGAPVSLTWDGKATNGTVVPDGVYQLRFAPIDRAGNVGTVVGRSVQVIGYLSHVRSSVARFYPHDGDRFAGSTTLSFRLARPATVTWRITRLDGTPVVTIRKAAATPAGTQSFVWKGLDQAGRRVPTGMYVSVVQASDGRFPTTQKTWVDVNAFTIRTTDATPARGQRVDITALSAEPISGSVLLHVTQPGLAPWSVRMTRITGGWKAPITFRASSAGQVVLRVSALDADGRWQRTYLYLPLE
jgi:flagellar hook assembly protein FlgD